jgi:hypothetical protein
VFDQVFHVFFTDSAQEEGAPTDWFESDLVRWVPLAEIRDDLGAGRIQDGLTLTALSWCFASGPLADRAGP